MGQSSSFFPMQRVQSLLDLPFAPHRRQGIHFSSPQREQAADAGRGCPVGTGDVGEDEEEKSPADPLPTRRTIKISGTITTLNLMEGLYHSLHARKKCYFSFSQNSGGMS